MPIAPICSHPPLTSFRLRFSDHKILLRLTCGGACASHVNPTVLPMIWQNYHQARFRANPIRSDEGQKKVKRRALGSKLRTAPVFGMLLNGEPEHLRMR